MINGFTRLDKAVAPAGSGAILDQVQQAWGFVPNLHHVHAA